MHAWDTNDPEKLKERLKHYYNKWLEEGEQWRRADKTNEKIWFQAQELARMGCMILRELDYPEPDLEWIRDKATTLMNEAD